MCKSIDWFNKIELGDKSTEYSNMAFSKVSFLEMLRGILYTHRHNHSWYKNKNKQMKTCLYNIISWLTMLIKYFVKEN